MGKKDPLAVASYLRNMASDSGNDPEEEEIGRVSQGEL